MNQLKYWSHIFRLDIAHLHHQNTIFVVCKMHSKAMYTSEKQPCFKIFSAKQALTITSFRKAYRTNFVRHRTLYCSYKSLGQSAFVLYYAFQRDKLWIVTSTYPFQYINLKPQIAVEIAGRKIGKMRRKMYHKGLFGYKMTL